MPYQHHDPLSTNLLAKAVMDGACPHSRVIDAAMTLSYDELSSMACGVADALSQTAAAPVAVCTRKSPETIAAILGILQSGRPYAPLDPTHPAARLEAILAGLSPGAIIVDGQTHEKLLPLVKGIGAPVFLLGQAGVGKALTSERQTTILPREPLKQAVCGTLAAILHTSGSTGIPKKVLIGARAIDLFADWVKAEFRLSPQDCLLSHAPLAFDLSLLDIFAGLAAGASILLADAEEARNGDRLAHMIERHGVTFLHATPSALSLLVQAAKGRTFPGVRAVLFAGEPISRAGLNDLVEAFPNARLTNIYGCTETNDTFLYHVPRVGAPDPLPLGEPLPYVDYRILDESGFQVAAGEDGILWVACSTTMDGYGDEALTNAVFAEFGDGIAYYNTKDRVRLDGDGRLRFLGRVDTVKKVNGYRIDLGEIEACLSRVDGIGEVAVFERPSSKGNLIAAAISPADPALTALSVRIQAMKFLPSHAIPKQIIVMKDALPKNSNGKICRKTLSAINI